MATWPIDKHVHRWKVHYADDEEEWDKDEMIHYVIDKFSSPYGVTPRKKHRTGLFDLPLEAAIAFAQLREDLELGTLAKPAPKKPAMAGATTAPKKVEVGAYLGDLLRQQRAGVPLVRAWLLSEQQAAAALAGGMQQGFAFAKA